MTRVTVERAYVDGRFGQLHLYRAGPRKDSSRPPLMCFHMSPFSAVIYERFLSEMGKDRLAVAVDTRVEYRSTISESRLPFGRPSMLTAHRATSMTC